jgi:hypothetical protein
VHDSIQPLEKGTRPIGVSSASIIAEDTDGDIWVAARVGVYRFDGLRWQHYTPENSGVTGSEVVSVSADSQDRIWVATVHGLSVYDKKAAGVEPVACGRVCGSSGCRLSVEPGVPGRSVVVRYAIARPLRTRLAVHDSRGRIVRVLADRMQPAGTHTVAWPLDTDVGRRLGSGCYVVSLATGTQRLARTVQVVR